MGKTVRSIPKRLRHGHPYGPLSQRIEPEGTYKGGREKIPSSPTQKSSRSTQPKNNNYLGDDKQTRSYCYIDDAVTGTIMLMESNYDKPVNIGFDRLVAIDELTDIIIKISDKTIRKEYDLTASQDVRGRNADLTLVRNKIGWNQK